MTSIRKRMRAICLEKKLLRSIRTFHARDEIHEEEREENVPQKDWDDLFESAFIALDSGLQSSDQDWDRFPIMIE